MKKLFLCVIVSLLVFGVCFAEDGEPSKEEVGRALGALMGGQLKELGLDFDYDVFLDSLRKGYEGAASSLIDGAAAEAVLQTAYTAVQTRVAAENQKKSATFLMENAKKKGVKTTSSGLQYEVIAQGSGEKPVFDSYVVVNYTGSLIDGSVFDSNRETGGDPATIPLEGVIEGWAEGVRLMNVGGHYKLYIPPDLAYGADGAGDTIPPNSVLVFDVELLDIEK